MLDKAVHGRKMKSPRKIHEPVYVTQPTMPELKAFVSLLEDIWDSKWLTNNGVFHQLLENAICDHLGVKFCSLFCNGTLALMVAIKALKLKGEIITTPFTFPATVNVIDWLGIVPVFCDIDERNFNIDPNKIEKHINRKTSAIIPVHVYGVPCDVDAINNIAEDNGLKVIYDAAHAFGVKINNKSVVEYGNASMLSFHATKLFTTLEGGALVVHDVDLKREVEILRNFGIVDEETVVAAGINAKMNEVQAAFGILHLKNVNNEIRLRKRIAFEYRKALASIPGLILSKDVSGVEQNYSYFPILVEKDGFGMSRDELYSTLKTFGVNTRKYFYPLATYYGYMGNSLSRPQLPVAERVSREVLCLPIYGNLKLETVIEICKLIRTAHEQSVRMVRKRRIRE
jgi:dTDP-4-amino-4,6-dideoxygalactose transaminase